jgi:ribosomal protein S18 acetylase RimI-like enzyme
MHIIRKATHTDLEQVRTCAVEAYTRYLERIGKKPAPMVADFAALIEAGTLSVIELDGQVRGFVVCYGCNDYLHLENVAVDPRFQGLGLGRQLIDYVEQQARSGGYGSIQLYTNAKMTENLGLYPRLGYEQFDRRVENGFDRVYFSKTLD